MDYHQWKRQLLENPKLDAIPQGVEQNPTLDKIRKAGDVGKREVLSRVTGRDVPSREYAQTAQNITQDAGVTQWTDGQQPGDSDDLEFTRQQALMRFAPDYAQHKTATAAELRAGLPNIEDMPLKKRMRLSADAIGPMGGLTVDKNVDDAMNDAIKASESPNSRGTIDGGEAGEIDDIRYQRHKMQPEMELGYEITPDEVATLISLTADDRKDPYLVKQGAERGQSKQELISREAGENPINALKYVSGGGGIQRPSARDVENLNPEAMQQALEDGRITEEQFERQMTVLTALARDDAQGLQSALFQHEVGDDAVDAFYANADLRKAGLGTRGLSNSITDDARWRKAYGGNLPASMDKFKVEGAPDGVYDLYAMNQDPEGSRYVKQAINNREREVIRTWLKQGGRDAYAHHEGVRSILDMNLEHIKAISGEGNFDHPSNWVWASQELNKLKNKYNLIDRVKEYAEPVTSRAVSDDYTPQSYNDIKDAMSAEQRATWRAAFPEFRNGNTKIGAGGMSLDQYDQFTPDEIAEFRNRAIDLGYSKAESEKIFPEVQDRVDRQGFNANPEGWEQDRQREENESILLQQWAEKMKSKGLYRKQADALNSPEGQAFREKLANWGEELPQNVNDMLEDDEDVGL